MKTVLMLRASMSELATGEYILRGVNIERLYQTGVVIFSASAKRKLGVGPDVELFAVKKVSFVKVDSDTQQTCIAIRFDYDDLTPIASGDLPIELKERVTTQRNNRFFLDVPDTDIAGQKTEVDKKSMYLIKRVKQNQRKTQEITLNDFSVEEILQHLKQRLGQTITITM